MSVTTNTNKQTVSLNVPLVYVENWRSTFTSLEPNSIYTLIIDYPLHNPGKFVIKTNKNGMNVIQLVNKINQCYNKVYKSAEKSNNYGIWGHCKEDLVIEGIYIDHSKKKITLGMGS